MFRRRRTERISRNAMCIRTAPKVEPPQPNTATGLPSRLFSDCGRDNQSIAFLSTPGTLSPVVDQQVPAVWHCERCGLPVNLTIYAAIYPLNYGILRPEARTNPGCTNWQPMPRLNTLAGAPFVRGVVEVSNYCRENCHYCGMRRDNKSLDRARGA